MNPQSFLQSLLHFGLVHRRSFCLRTGGPVALAAFLFCANESPASGKPSELERLATTALEAPKPKARLAAVEKLPAGSESDTVLGTVAMEDSDRSVREAALNKVAGQATLARIACFASPLIKRVPAPNSHPSMGGQLYALERAGATIKYPGDDRWIVVHDYALNLAAVERLIDRSLLFVVAMEADNEEVRRSAFRRHPLLPAAEQGDLQVMKQLLEEGSSVVAKLQDLEGPLMVAAHNGHYEVVKFLLEEGTAANATANGRGMLMIAAMRGNLDRVRELQEKGGPVEAMASYGFTPLMIASENGDLELVKLLLEYGAAVDAKTDGAPPLRFPVFKPPFDQHKDLLKSIALSEAASCVGVTSLMLAAQNGHLGVVKLLLEKGSTIDAASSLGFTPLLFAVQKGHLEVVELLLDKKALMEVKTQKGEAPLILAAGNGHLGVVKLLLEKGVPVDTRNTDAGTPLTFAAWRGHRDVAKLLLEKGATVDAKASTGWTPLMFAASGGSPDVVKLLLEKGAAVNAKGNDGATPLALAALSRHLEAVRLLLEKGANPDAKYQGMTPLRLARAWSDEGIVELLLKAGAK